MVSTIASIDFPDESHLWLGQCETGDADKVIAGARAFLAEMSAANIDLVQKATGSASRTELWLQRNPSGDAVDRNVAPFAEQQAFKEVQGRLSKDLASKGLSPFILVFSEVWVPKNPCAAL
jgi:hypothetical protein